LTNASRFRRRPRESPPRDGGCIFYQRGEQWPVEKTRGDPATVADVIVSVGGRSERFAGPLCGLCRFYRLVKASGFQGQDRAVCGDWLLEAFLSACPV
jgi:hypothetical protein